MTRLYRDLILRIQLGIVICSIVGDTILRIGWPDLLVYSIWPAVLSLPRFTVPAAWGVLVVVGVTLINLYINVALATRIQNWLADYSVPFRYLISQGTQEEVVYRVSETWCVAHLFTLIGGQEVGHSSYGMAAIVVSVHFVLAHEIFPGHWQSRVQQVLVLMAMGLGMSLVIRDLGLWVAAGMHFLCNVVCINVALCIAQRIFLRRRHRKWYFTQGLKGPGE